MALSDITRKTARSDLRARIAQYTQKDIGDGELNQWLDMGQFDVATRLSAISDMWYGVKDTVAAASLAFATASVTEVGISSAATSLGIKPKDVAKFLTFVAGATSGLANKVIPWTRIEDIHGYIHNTNWDSGYAVSHFGENVYFFFGGSSGVEAATTTLTNFYIRKPDEMTADTDTVDVPTEFVDLVLMYAQSKALGKLGVTQGKQEVDADIAARFNEIKQSYQQEVGQRQAEAQPGVQTRTR